MRKRILSYFILLVTLTVIVSMLLLTAISYNMFEQRVIRDLALNAKLLASAQEELYDGAMPDAVKDELRVTIIGADGVVLYDNQSDPLTMENHADRSEVIDALAMGSGEAVRKSRTVSRSTYYYATLLPGGDVLRLGMESRSIWSMYMNVVPLTLIIMAALIAMCCAVANLLTKRLLQPIEEMAGDMDNASDMSRYPELSPFVDRIRAQHEEILGSANMRVEFTANVSHELKTPLTSISGYAELIESGMADGEQAKAFAHNIHKSANRLLTLINDIIRLSQMDAPMQSEAFEPVNLMQVAEATIDQLRLNAENMHVQLEVDARCAVVNADRQMMEELLYNLCDNAIRYNVRGGSVRVSVHPVRDRVILCVQDTGIGISKEHQPRVFERFYRVDKSRSKATGGTGLGLAIVKHIAARHNAQIAIESELGRGTSISVTFERYR